MLPDTDLQHPIETLQAIREVEAEEDNARKHTIPVVRQHRERHLVYFRNQLAGDKQWLDAAAKKDYRALVEIYLRTSEAMADLTRQMFAEIESTIVQEVDLSASAASLWLAGYLGAQHAAHIVQCERILHYRLALTVVGDQERIGLCQEALDDLAARPLMIADFNP